jgi:hypothetical protein
MESPSQEVILLGRGIGFDPGKFSPMPIEHKRYIRTRFMFN